MKKRVLGLALAAVLAVVGIFLITAASRDDSDQAADRAVASVPASSAAAGSGEVAAAAPSTVAPAPPVTGPGGLAIPGDLVRLTLQLEPQRALGGLLRAGDKVAVAASFDAGGGAPSAAAGSAAAGSQTAVLLEKVLVVNVQVPSGTDSSSDSKDDSKDEADAAAPTTIPSGNLLVTLAVPAADAKKVVFASEYGRVWLAAESDASGPAGGAAVSRVDVLPEPTP